MEVFQADTWGRTATIGEQRTLEDPSKSLSDPDEWDELFGDSASSTGIRVSREAALKLSGFLRGVHVISARLAELPLYVWRERSPDAYQIDRSHRANKFIRLRASDEVSALRIKHTTQAHALTHGNGYIYAKQNRLGDVIEMLQLLPDRTRPTRMNGRLQYVTSIGGTLDDPKSELRYLDPDEVIHIAGLGWDGFQGYSVLRMGREVLGGALATQAFGNNYFRNNAMVGMVLETEKELGDKAYARMKNLWHKSKAGLQNAHKAAILEEGTKARWPEVKAADAQLLESKRFDLGSIEHLLNLPPGFLAGRANQRNAETDNQDMIDNCLSYWMSNWESELSSKLLSTEEYESEKYKIVFDRKQLQRSNIAAQATFWRTALGGRPWATQLEARKATGLDPDIGENTIAEPLNMGSLQASADGGSQKGQASARSHVCQNVGCEHSPLSGESGYATTHQRIVADAVRRMAKRVATFVERQLSVVSSRKTTDNGQLTTDILKKFESDHETVIRDALSICSPLTREGKLDQWFLDTVAAPLRALADGEPATSPESLATFFESLPTRAAELV